MGAFLEVIAQAVARQVKGVDGVDNRGGVEQGVLVTRVMVVNGERHCLRLACGEIGARAICKREVSATGFGVRVSVVVLDKATRPAHQIEPHEFAPVVSVQALFKGSQ